MFQQIISHPIVGWDSTLTLYSAQFRIQVTATFMLKGEKKGKMIDSGYQIVNFSNRNFEISAQFFCGMGHTVT